MEAWMLVPALMVVVAIAFAVAIRRGGSKSNSGAQTIATTNAYSGKSHASDPEGCSDTDSTETE